MSKSSSVVRLGLIQARCSRNPDEITVRSREKEIVKRRLAAQHARDRIAYTHGKSEFIEQVTRAARRNG